MKFSYFILCLLLLCAPFMAHGQEDMFEEQFGSVPQNHPLRPAYNFDGDIFGPSAAGVMPNDMFITTGPDPYFYGSDLFNPPWLAAPPDDLFQWSGAPPHW